MSEIKLKPYPFCGGEAIISRNDMIIKRKSQRCAWVYCQKCGAKTPYYMRSNFEHYMRSAIEAWNRRAYNKPIRQSCKSCKHYTPDPNYRNGNMGNCRYLAKIWEKPFYVNEARAECEHFQAAERRNENGNET